MVKCDQCHEDFPDNLPPMYTLCRALCEWCFPGQIHAGAEDVARWGVRRQAPRGPDRVLNSNATTCCHCIRDVVVPGERYWLPVNVPSDPAVQRIYVMVCIGCARKKAPVRDSQIPRALLMKK